MSQHLEKTYFKGMNYYNRNDYINARKYFELSYHTPGFMTDSLYRLLQIDLREGKYAKARMLLNANKDNHSLKLKKIYGLLENIENNFKTAKKYYNECLLEPKLQNKALLSIAKLYIQTGDNEIAKKMLETLQLNPNYEIQAIISLICLNILEQDYQEAKRLLQEIDVKKLTPKVSQHYKFLTMYIKYFNGELKIVPSNLSQLNDYMIYRLFDNSDELLLKHLKKHLNQKERNSNGCFLPNTDLKKLLNIAQETIKNLNPNHFENSDMYRFRLDNPIGYKEKDLTKDLCVVTIIGTKDILTMYPVSLSDEFDKEGFSTNKELILKRNNGGIN